MQLASDWLSKNFPLRGCPAGAGILRNAESCQGVICGKSSAERSANYPLSLFCIPQPKNSAFPRIAKLPFACIAQQMCNRCIAVSGVPRSLEKWKKMKNSLLDIAAQCWLVQELLLLLLLLKMYWLEWRFTQKCCRGTLHSKRRNIAEAAELRLQTSCREPLKH